MAISGSTGSGGVSPPQGVNADLKVIIFIRYGHDRILHLPLCEECVDNLPGTNTFRSNVLDERGYYEHVMEDCGF